MIRRSLALLTAVVALAACGGEPTASQSRPDTGSEARRSTSRYLTVTVYGPGQLSEGECATWYSTVAGGVEPYQYSWSGVYTTDNTSSWVTGWIGGPGYPLYNFVRVDVTDATGKIGSGEMVVYVPGPNSQGVPGC